MVIGNGLISKSFKEYFDEDNSILIFASGVSNSQETDSNNFLREKKLLTETIEKNLDKQIIYFSTILIDFKSNPYYTHKKEMEILIKNLSNNYLIFRVPQLIGELGNDNNLINYLVSKIRDNKEFNIYKNSKRSIIDIKDVVNLVKYCIGKIKCETLYINGIEIISIVDLVDKIAYILNNKVSIKIINNIEDNNWVTLRSDIFNDYINTLKIDNNGYTEKILRKYIKI